MKNFLLTILFLSSTLTYSQSLDVTGNMNISSNPCMQAHSTLTVKNISSISLDIICEKVIIDTTLGTSNFFCWAANCYPSSTYISPSTNTILAGDSDNTDFGGYYDAYCDPASATVQYCFYPDNNPSDATCVTILYNGNISTIIESDRVLKLNSFYPNPAEQSTSIEYVASKDSYLNIVDILGNSIKKYALDYSGKLNIDTRGLLKGVYFGNLIVDNQIISVKKLIIK
jgi:hypothetical protein|tara:strand:+ start:414 stop:1097 length:684 start_codon:yes stop_codon:yes gene_type:complete